ncbi:MAG: serine/threonine protein kinase, partial [Myxococcales bacterium]|nr:serine/threonine protein kinase [Myxococcales bacterium]
MPSAVRRGMQEFQRTQFGDYVLQDRIGAGGMAEIFLATAQGIEGFEKRLVIKRILPTLSDDEQFVRMFIEEAKLCVALRHPNIVQVYDLGEIDYQYFIAMEFVDGRDLLKTLAACGRKKIGFPTDIALYIVMETLKGLEYAHHLERPDGEPLGIIHRDVSPSNVLLSFEGEVKLCDFGIAKASTREKTATGILKGKFGYMAPEQVTGAPIDHRADVFAVGIVLYELLTGHRLFAGKNDLMVLERVRDAVIDPLPRFYRPDLDDELEGIVLKALARRADDRFQSAGALHDAIHDYVYRSRAMVGPSQLGRFMQGLFLSEPEEQARRNRVRLPPVPSPEERAASMAPPFAVGGFGPEKTEDERGKHRDDDEDGDFDEKTPLLELEPSRPSSSLSKVVYISDEYDWGQSERNLDETRSEPGSGPVVRPQPLEASGPEAESTVQTDVSLEVSDADVEAISAHSDAAYRAYQRDERSLVPTQTPDPRGEVMAMRRARAQDNPTDFDLQDEPGYAELVGGDDSELSTDAPDTLAEREAAPRAFSVATELHGDDLDDDTRTEQGGVEPAAIVERTRTTPVEPTRSSAPPADAEPTVQFDSSIYPALRDEDVRKIGDGLDEGQEVTVSQPPPLAPEPPRVHLVDGVEGEYGEPEDHSQHGTLQVEQGDLPTAEVHESELRDSELREDSTLTTPGSVDEDDDTLLREDEAGEIAALLERHANSTRPTAAPSQDEDLDDASRTDLYNPVEEGMVAELAARAPSRRQPISRGRSRPALMPAESRGASSGSGFGQRSPPRRRVATRVPLSVVNPGESGIHVREEPAERAVSTIPTPVAPDRGQAIDRVETGAGSLVEVEAYQGGAVPKEAMGRRESSGVTAALSEAALVDEQIAELRRSSVSPRDNTTAGLLAQHERTVDLTDDEYEEATQDGHGADLRSAILRRQSRRRMVTRSFVLYGDQDGKAAARQDSASFAEDSEQSVRAITNAGQLEDEGASDLFGVLSVLDEEQPDFGFEADEEMSQETDARYYPDLMEAASRVEAHTPPPRLSSEQAQAVEFGHTSLGSLNPDDTGLEPMVYREDSILPDFASGGDEDTASVTDGQVVSVSHAGRKSPFAARPDVYEAEQSLSGIELEFTSDGPFEELSASGQLDPSLRGELISDVRHGAPFSAASEEPTQEAGSKAPTRPNPDPFAAPDLTSGDRPSHRDAQLVSESYDFGAGRQANWHRQRRDTPVPATPVRPVSMVAPPAGVEPTRSQLADFEPAGRRSRTDDDPGRRRAKQEVRRAGEERRRVAPEYNQKKDGGKKKPGATGTEAPLAAF